MACEVWSWSQKASLGTRELAVEQSPPAWPALPGVQRLIWGKERPFMKQEADPGGLQVEAWAKEPQLERAQSCCGLRGKPTGAAEELSLAGSIAADSH